MNEHIFDGKPSRSYYARGCPCEECRISNREYARKRRKGMTDYDKATRYDFLASALEAFAGRDTDENRQLLRSRAELVLSGKLDGSRRPAKKGTGNA